MKEYNQDAIMAASIPETGMLQKLLRKRLSYLQNSHFLSFFLTQL